MGVGGMIITWRLKYLEKNLFRCHFVHLRLVWIRMCWKIPFVPRIKDGLIKWPVNRRRKQLYNFYVTVSCTNPYRSQSQHAIVRLQAYMKMFEKKHKVQKPCVCLKVKQSLYRPGQPLWVPGDWGSQISRRSAHEGGKVSPTHRPPLSPREYSWYSFLPDAASTAGPQCGRKGYVIKGNRTHDLPAWSAVPQPTAPPRDPCICVLLVKCDFVLYL